MNDVLRSIRMALVGTGDEPVDSLEHLQFNVRNAVRQIDAVLLAQRPPQLRPCYYCNKCGYIGPVRFHHGSGCTYYAALIEPEKQRPAEA